MTGVKFKLRIIKNKLEGKRAAKKQDFDNMFP
jgi:hypothetical protein